MDYFPDYFLFKKGPTALSVPPVAAANLLAKKAVQTLNK